MTVIAREPASFGSFVADWPLKVHDRLLETLSKRGSRLGVSTGQRFLRHMGHDTYVMTPDVIARLCEEGVIDRAPSSKRAKAAVQAAFNKWTDESGRGLSQ